VPKDHLQELKGGAVKIGVGAPPRPGHVECSGTDTVEPSERFRGWLPELQLDHPKGAAELFCMLVS
jgi:hypothetical protein